LGENCDVDVQLVHDPDSEEKFIEAGYGVDRTQVMYNDFVIIGPEDDPAGIKGLSSTEALKRIREAFVLLLKRDEEVYSAVSATLRASTAAIIISLIWHGFTALPMRSFRFGAVAFVHQGPENIIPGPWEKLENGMHCKRLRDGQKIYVSGAPSQSFVYSILKFFL
jgi:hypothetical protein